MAEARYISSLPVMSFVRLENSSVSTRRQAKSTIPGGHDDDVVGDLGHLLDREVHHAAQSELREHQTSNINRGG